MNSKIFFEESEFIFPQTEGIKYAGSKLQLLPYILQMVARINPKVVYDACSGTTRVSQALAQQSYNVIASDIAVWSEVFANCYLRASPSAPYKDLIAHLNHCRPMDGWFSWHYGGNPFVKTETKRPWQIHNTRKLDGIREEIDRISLSKLEKAVALTSLILALDKVDNTVGHQASYLKDWCERSYKKLWLNVPRLGSSVTGKNTVLCGDVFDFSEQVVADLTYFDPPYGSSNENMPPSRIRYAAYYHIWKTICLNDKPKVFGKVNRREDSKDTNFRSDFEDFRRNAAGKLVAIEAVGKVLRKFRSKYIILSYSFGSREVAHELYAAISTVGRILEIQEIPYKKHAMASMVTTKEWVSSTKSKNTEILFLIEKFNH